MATTSVNKKQNETVDNKAKDKEASPKLVVNNSAALEAVGEMKEVVKKTIRKKAGTEDGSTAKKTATKSTTKKPKEEKKTVTKSTDAKKEAITKTVTSKASKVKTSMVLQYQSLEVDIETLIQKVKVMWIEAHGKQEKDIKSLQLYMKPEEYSAYYVINDTVKGRIDL